MGENLAHKYLLSINSTIHESKTTQGTDLLTRQGEGNVDLNGVGACVQLERVM